jgi:hypothetical protein
MQNKRFKKHNKVFVMYRLLILMIIVFNSTFGQPVQAQDSKSESIKAHLDSIKAAHLEKAAQLKSEIMEKQEAYQKAIKDAYSKNIVIINGQIYYAKDSLDVKLESGAEIHIRGESNQVMIESRGEGNTVKVTQSGKENKVSISQTSPKQTKKEDENNQ